MFGRVNFTHIFQEFSVQITFREQWNDERLRFDDQQGEPTAHKF